MQLKAGGGGRRLLSLSGTEPTPTAHFNGDSPCTFSSTDTTAGQIMDGLRASRIKTQTDPTVSSGGGKDLGKSSGQGTAGVGMGIQASVSSSVFFLEVGELSSLP